MSEIFRLEVGGDRLATLTFDLPGKKLNVFTRAALTEQEVRTLRGVVATLAAGKGRGRKAP